MSTSTIILIGLISIINSQTSQECTDEYECQQDTIQKTEITCSGLESCTEASLTSPKAAGFIHCSGHASCGDFSEEQPEGTITASNIVYCSALQSCAYAGISSKSLDCTGYYSCNNPEAVNAIEIDTEINCGGSFSCQKNIFSGGDEVNCNGGSGCNKATITGGDSVNCNGITSCYDAIMSDQESFISCLGATSCASSIISNTDQVRLHGYMAGMASDITGVSVVKAFGASSMKRATIDSYGLTDLDVQAYGAFAGELADIICRSGSTCNLECKGTGCYDLKFSCESGATCNINPDGCLPDNSVNDVNGVICPEISVASDLVKKSVIKTIDAIDRVDNEVIDAMDRVFEDIKKRRNKVKSLTDIRCGTENECDGDKLNSAQNDIYCTGKSSCSNSNLKTGLQSEDSQIFCDAENSCISSVLYTELGTVRCNGEESCDNGDITSELVYCFGYRSCAEADIQVIGSATSRQVFCGGELSCAMAIIQDSGYVFCAGNEACLGATFTGEYEVDCDGDMSCKQAEVTAGRDIRCTGNYACFRALSLTAAQAVTIKGTFGAMRADIYADRVEGLAYGSLYGATIDSQGRDSVIVYAYGYNAGDGATFVCRSGSECTLDCKGSGCNNLEYYCIAGATCNIEPAQCGNGRSIVQGVDCPIITTAASDKEADEYIKQKQAKNQRLYDLLEEYINDGMGSMEFEELLVMVQNEMKWFGFINNEDIIIMITGLILFVALLVVCGCYKFKSGKGDYEILK